MTCHRFDGHTGKVLSARFSPNGRLIASGGEDRVVRIWDVATGKELCALAGHTREISAVSFLSDGKHIVSSGGDRTIKLWDLDTRREYATFTGHGGWVMCVDVSPDGKTIASGCASGSETSHDATIKLWNVASLKEIASVSTERRVNAICYSPDARLIAASTDDGMVAILRANTGEVVTTMSDKNETQLLSVAFSPDSATVATCDGDTIRLWDSLTGHCRANLVADDRTPAMTAYAAAFSSNGRTLVAVGGASVRIWDIRTMKRQSTLAGRSTGLCSVFFKPCDPQVFVTAATSGLVNIRSLDEDRPWWKFW
jgi:WD40 repeat protein